MNIFRRHFAKKKKNSPVWGHFRDTLYIVPLMNRQHEMTEIWTYFTINYGNESRPQAAKYQEEELQHHPVKN